MSAQLRRAGLMALLSMLTVVFFTPAANEARPSLPTHYITVAQGLNGKITPAPPSGQVNVPEGRNKLFTLKPNRDYHVSEIIVDGTPIAMVPDGVTLKQKGKTYKYIFQNVTTDTHTITATFEPDPTYTLSLSSDGGGSGTITSSPGGINCGVDCAEAYKEGKVVTLTVRPDGASIFTGWSGACTGTSKTCKITMDGEKAVTASFGPKAVGLRITEKVSVVDTAGGPLSQRMMLSAPDFPSDSDYSKDPTFVYVNDRSADTFEMVNEILCMIAQTKYDEMVNKGNYRAQIDENLCNSSNDDPSKAGEGSQNQSSSSTMPKYQMWTVNSSRASNDSPQIVKAWIHEAAEPMDEEPGVAIFAKTVITESVSESNPYGIFTVNFKGFPEVDGSIPPGAPLFFKGFLKTENDPETGRVLLKYVSEDDFNIPGEGRVIFREKATLNRKFDGSSGGGTVYNFVQEPFGENGEAFFDFAFNPTHFLREDEQSSSVCLSRTEFDETAWSYGLYDANGTRVNRNSGFSIRTTKDSKDYFGWIGYWGLWFPKEVTLTNGETVYKMNYGPGGATEEAYTTIISGGKLKKHTRNELILGQIKNIPLDYWPWQGEGQPSVGYHVIWDGSNFKKVEQFNQDDQIWEKLEIVEDLDLSALNSDMINFWSRSLGGSVQIKLSCTMEPVEPPPPGTPWPAPVFDCTASDELPVVFYAETILYPSDMIPAELACFTNCPDLAKINSAEPYPYNNDYDFPQEMAPSEAQYVPYTFDKTSMVLKSGGINVTTTNSIYQFAVMSGPLVEPSSENLALLACDWDTSKTCGWQAWSKVPVYYTWETGPNQWNHFSALKNPADDTVLKFDPPLLVNYVHQWPDLSTSTFNLEYNGFGNLHGIPGKCIDRDTGDEVSCSPNTRWIPQFSIAQGAEVTDASDNLIKYYVKALKKEQRMKVADESDCSQLTATPYALGDISQWVDPNIGAEPVVDGPPAVVGGVLQ